MAEFPVESDLGELFQLFAPSRLRWYQRSHGGKIVDLEYQRHKMIDRGEFDIYVVEDDITQSMLPSGFKETTSHTAYFDCRANLALVDISVEDILDDGNRKFFVKRVLNYCAKFNIIRLMLEVLD